LISFKAPDGVCGADDWSYKQEINNMDGENLYHQHILLIFHFFVDESKKEKIDSGRT
jgi:hypothetical protein